MNPLTMEIAIMAAIAIGVFLRIRHCHTRDEQRRCTFMIKPGPQSMSPSLQCRERTHRVYRMIRDESKPLSLWGVWYIWLVFDVGDECLHHVVLVKGDPGSSKFFNWWKLAWRRLTNMSQFGRAEEMLADAGLLPRAVPPLAERLKVHGEVSRFLQRVQAGLDAPPTGIKVFPSRCYRPPAFRLGLDRSKHQRFGD